MPEPSNISQLLEHASKYAFDPEKWAFDIIHFEADAWQAKAMRDFIEKGFVALSTGSGTGKTAYLAVMTLFFLANRPFPKVPCTAPTQHQLHDILWAEIKKWMRRSELLSKMFSWTQTKVSLIGHEEEWFAVARTSRPKPKSTTVEGLQGFHAEHLLYILDEACFDDKTEILTDGGFKLFKDLIHGVDKVLTLNPETNIAHYELPTAYQTYDYDGELFRYHQRGCSFAVTPNHNMFVGIYNSRKKEYIWKSDTIDHLFERSEFYMRRNFVWLGEEKEEFTLPSCNYYNGIKNERKIKMDAWVTFLGWFLSEGSIAYVNDIPYGVKITQTKNTLYTAMIAVACIGIGYAYSVCKDAILISDKQLASYLAQFGKQKDRFVPRYVHELSPRQIKLFLSSYLAGDGYHKQNRDVYYTSSVKMANDLQELTVKSGKSSTLTTRKLQPSWIKDHWAHPTCDGCVVSTNSYNSDIKVRSYNVEKLAYKGKVYCVNVEPFHTIFVRRDGYCMWSGNSGVPDQVTGAVDGALTTKGAHVIMASNPTRNVGYFHRTVTDPKINKDWAITFVNAEHSKFVTKESIQKLRDRYGEDSDYYRMRVKGLFPRTDSTSLISPEQVFNAHSRVIDSGNGNGNGNGGVKLLSLDPARYGPDDSIILGATGNTLKERHKFNGMDSATLCDFVCNIFNVGEYDELRIDDVGIGGPVLDIARRKLGKKKVVGVTAGASPIWDIDQFLNLRAEIFWNIREKINEISIPFETENLDEELISIHYKWDSKDKKIQIESKDIIRQNLGRSCGDADALAILYSKLKSVNLSHGVFFALGAKYVEGGKIVNTPKMKENHTIIGQTAESAKSNDSGSGRLTNMDTWKVSNNRIGRSRFGNFI